MRPPAILATMHVGPMVALGFLLDQLNAPTVAFTAGLPSRPRLATVDSGGGEWKRARALAEAVHALRAGSFAFMAMDGAGTRRVAMPMLDRQVDVGAGVFALARLTGAPLVPVAARWREPRIEIGVGPMIEPSDERTMAAGTGAWFEGFVREHPYDLGPDFVDLLLGSPA